MKIILNIILLSILPFYISIQAQNKLDSLNHQGYPNQSKVPTTDSTKYLIDRYYQLLNHEPQNDQMRFNLIDELIKANRYEEAYRQLQYLSSVHQEEEQYKLKYKLVSDYRDSTFSRDVDRYTEILKSNPSDKSAVLELASAYGNLFYYDSAIEILSEYLEDIPDDQDPDVRFKYAHYCAWNYEWGKSINQLNKLLGLEPNNLDYQLLRGQISAWTSMDLDISEQYLLNVINSRPQDVQALVALGAIYSWKNNFTESKKYLDAAVSIDSENRILNKAIVNYELKSAEYEKNKMLDTLKSDARRLALEGKYEQSFSKYEQYKSNKKILDRDELIEYAGICSEAKQYQKAIDAYKKILDEEFEYKLALRLARNYYLNQETMNALRELENLNKIDTQNEEMKLLLADTYAVSNQLDEAEDIYHNLLSSSKDEKTKNELYLKLAILADHYVQNKNYEKANSLYKEIQAKTSDSEIIRKVFIKQIDMSYALISDKKLNSAEDLLYTLNKKNKDEELKKELNNKRLFLGDAYTLEHKYGAAENVYESILDETQDTADVRIVKERLSWLPPSGFSRGFGSIKNFMNFFLPTNISWTPFSSYYSDNQKFQSWIYGARLEAGFIGVLSLGASLTRTNLSNPIINWDFTQFKGLAGIYFSKNLSVSGSYGVLNIFGEPDRRIGDVALKYEEPDEFSVVLSYENNDARMVLYSSNFINSRINTNYYCLNAFYDHRNIIRLSVYYNYFHFGDGNEGNDLQLRLGKRFFENGIFGYEYYFTDLAFISYYYYSPQNYGSHSIWTDWDWAFKKFKISAGGKIGFVPSADFIISELFGEVNYNPIASLILTGKLGYGNSPRYNSGYKNYSASLMASWCVF